MEKVAYVALAVLSFIALVAIISNLHYRHQIIKLANGINQLNGKLTLNGLKNEVTYREVKQLYEGIEGLLEKVSHNETLLRKKEDDMRTTMTDLSHDIRAPLTSLDGYFELLMNTEDEEKKKNYMKIIETKIRSLNGMVDELFTYSKIQNDIFIFEKKKIDFSLIVTSTLLTFYDDYHNNNFMTDINLPEDDIYVLGNENALSRVIQNVLKNALVHGKSRIAISLKEEDEEAVFTCRNDCVDPDKIDITKVFERRYRSTGNRDKGTTGLGLTIAKGLMEKLGGTIEASMEHGDFVVQVRLKRVDKY